MDSMELMYSISLAKEELAKEELSKEELAIKEPTEDMRLNYYLISQKSGATDENNENNENDSGNSFGVMIEEIYQNKTNKNSIDDLCPVREEVVDFIDCLRTNRVTAATLYDVAYDWISVR